MSSHKYRAMQSGSYDARVKDIQAHFRAMKEALLAIEDRKSRILELRDDISDTVYSDIDKRESEMFQEVRLKFDEERSRAQSALQPLEDDLQMSDGFIDQVKRLVESVQTCVCTPRRSIALVDRHTEIVTSIRGLAEQVSNFLRHPIEEEAVWRRLDPLVNVRDRVPPIISAQAFSPSSCASSSQLTVSPRVSLGELQVNEAELLDSLFVYIDISDSPSTLGFPPHFRLRQVPDDLTAGELLAVVAARLDCDSGSLNLSLKTGATSSVLLPLHSGARIREELADLSVEEDEPSWPRLFVVRSKSKWPLVRGGRDISARDA